MFRPGIPTTLQTFPKRPIRGKLYGLPVGDDWVTVRLERDKSGETYHYCSRLRPGAFQGSRQQFLDWAGALCNTALTDGDAA